MKQPRRIRHQARRPRACRSEPLETRALLDATGVIWGDAPQLTLSFADEGTRVAGLSSALHGTFDQLASTDAWQGAILRAFQTWASATNGDIGVVVDSGLPFGIPGLSCDDARFGDVRIAAIPLASDVLAVSIPSDTLVAGSWAGDMLFNSNAAWTSLDELFSVALHEAGHVFGLQHSVDPLSPMHVHGVSSAIVPTSDDLAALAALHGTRMPDLNEYINSGNDGAPLGTLIGNETLATATRVKPAHDGVGVDGSAPAIVHGDITDDADIDTFWWDGLSDYSGPVTITVRPAGMSLLAPSVELLDEQGVVLQSVTSTSSTGEAVTIQLAENDRRGAYFLRVSGVAGVHGIGHYALTVSFDDVVTVDAERVARFAGREFRFLTANQIRDLFETSAQAFFNDDEHADDDPLESGELDTSVGFVKDTRYETVGSIADSTDVDHYRFKSPVSPLGTGVPLTIVVNPLESSGLIPRIGLFTGDGAPLSAPIVANGNGQLVVQLPDAPPDDEFLLRIRSADNTGVYSVGNYRMSIIFSAPVAELTQFASGTLTNSAPQSQHALFVGQSQLMHLLLDTTATTLGSNSAAWLAVYDDQGTVRYRVAAQAGDARSAGTMLLEPGAYTVRVSGIALDGLPMADLPYRLLGATISDPLGVVVGDPTDDPVYLCPGQQDFYCYPGGVQSPSPYLWNDFVLSEPVGQPPGDPNELFNNWWSWFWSLQPGDTNGDQAVGLDDLNNVRNHFGEAGATPTGDTNGDGDVDLDDLNQVRNNFGAGDSAPAPSARTATGIASPFAASSWWRTMVRGAAPPRARNTHMSATDAVFTAIAGEAEFFRAPKRARGRLA